MRTHLKMIYKAIQVVFVRILLLASLFTGIYGMSAFAQWRVDTNIARERAEQHYVENDMGMH